MSSIQALLFFSYIYYGMSISWSSSQSIQDQQDSNGECGLWHIRNSKGDCECGASLSGVICCDENFIYVENGYCLTWNNYTKNEELYHCLFTHWMLPHTGERYSIPINMSGKKLNDIMCKSFNRQGTQCSQCISGYGPAAYSDSVSCADCTQHTYIWILNLLFQLSMVTLMCVAFMILQIKGTSSPLNIIIAYIQNVAFECELSKFYFLGKQASTVITTILGIWNLDYFRLVFRPLCISSSLTAINCILFQYILAIYPLLFTSVVYLCIDHQRFAICCSPFKKCLNKACKEWHPKRTILHTFATLFLLSYTKLLFTSLSLLLAVHSYDVTGQKISESAVLLFDPSIRFLHSEHVPYAVIAFFILITCIIPPPILLVLYPTKIFKKCIGCLGFQRWDILHHIMDVFQGWYKDGTEGTQDYRFLSAFFLVLRIAHGGKIVVITLLDDKKERMLAQVILVGIFQISMGIMFFSLKPYKKIWMSNADGIIFTLIGCYILMDIFNDKLLNVSITVLVALFTIICVLYKTFKIQYRHVQI